MGKMLPWKYSLIVEVTITSGKNHSQCRYYDSITAYVERVKTVTLPTKSKISYVVYKGFNDLAPDYINDPLIKTPYYIVILRWPVGSRMLHQNTTVIRRVTTVRTERGVRPTVCQGDVS